MAGMNETPSGERVVVSEVRGTTTDPVKKAMEILPLGPVVIIDTPGFDDEGSLGELRVQRTKKILEQTDIAVLVVDTTEGFRKVDAELTDLFRERGIPFLIRSTGPSSEDRQRLQRHDTCQRSFRGRHR